MKILPYALACFLFLSGCRSSKVAFQDPVPAYQTFTLSSAYVQEDRVINVWLPPSYGDGTDRFPVLYMPDGGIKEDFPHIANTLAKLLEGDLIPAFILVGIENTERARDLTGASEVEAHRKYEIPMTDGAKNFRSFISEELIPEIEGKYRTGPEKGIVGESLAGLFVVETFFLEPALFDFYIAMDPSLWWNDNYLSRHAEQLLEQLPDRPTRLWFAGSKDLLRRTDALAESLDKKPTSVLAWKYVREPKEKHHTIFRATKEKAFIWIMNEVD